MESRLEYGRRSSLSDTQATLRFIAHNGPVKQPPITRVGSKSSQDDDRITGDLVRLYILHRSTLGLVTSESLALELGKRGITCPVRSVAQFLIGLERKAYILSSEMNDLHEGQRAYRATERGRAAAREAHVRLRNLYECLAVDSVPKAPLRQP